MRLMQPFNAPRHLFRSAHTWFWHTDRHLCSNYVTEKEGESMKAINAMHLSLYQAKYCKDLKINWSFNINLLSSVDQVLPVKNRRIVLHFQVCSDRWWSIIPNNLICVSALSCCCCSWDILICMHNFWCWHWDLLNSVTLSFLQWIILGFWSHPLPQSYHLWSLIPLAWWMSVSVVSGFTCRVQLSGEPNQRPK